MKRAEDYGALIEAEHKAKVASSKKAADQEQVLAVEPKVDQEQARVLMEIDRILSIANGQNKQN